VAGSGGVAWPVVSPTEVLERGLGGVNKETVVPLLKVDVGVRSQLGQDGSFLCEQLWGEVQEEVEGEGAVSSPFKENNLVDVRVVQVDYLDQQPVLRSVPTLLSNSATQNCNKIFKMKNKEYEAIKVWRVGKDMSYTRSGQEDIVISRLQSQEARDCGYLRNRGRLVRKYEYKGDRRFN